MSNVVSSELYTIIERMKKDYSDMSKMKLISWFSRQN